MADEHVQVVKQFYEAFNSGDIAAVFGMCDESIVLHEPEGSPFAGEYRGSEGIQEFLGKLGGAFEDIRLDAEEFLDAGDRAVVVGHFRAKAAGSGDEVDVSYCEYVHSRDGKITEFR